MELTIGSLFDGIGGFPLTGQRVGITPVWASEIEPFPTEVTKRHFPNMQHLGDITKINGAEITPVDIITFGSPCQDLSVAGKMAGLQGERSGLFMEAVRIIREMRAATGGKYPTFAVWENVPGALSSNNGQDFRAVLEEIAETEIPTPASGRWANSGMVRRNGCSIAWRILDAQHWGVPQRRRRIFLVADFGGQRAGEILFERQSLSGDTQEGRSKGKETAGNAGSGVNATMFDPYNNKCSKESPTLGTNCGMSTGRTILFEPRSQDGVPRIHEGVCPTLNTMQGGAKTALYSNTKRQNGNAQGECRST